jgi:hypothetical protein
VKRERRHGDVGEGPFLAQELGDEPAQAERLVGVRERIGALDQDDPAVPFRARLLGVPELEALGRARVADDDVARLRGVAHAGKNHRSAVAQHQDRGQGLAEAAQSVPREADELRAKVDFACDLDEMRGLNPVRTGGGELDELHFAVVEPVVAGYRGQTGYS